MSPPLSKNLQWFVLRNLKLRPSTAGFVTLSFLLLLAFWSYDSLRYTRGPRLSELNILQPPYHNLPKHRRPDAVRAAFLHAYSGYEKYAMPRDELLPLQNGSQQNFNGWGVTMYDGLDTLWLMGLKPEFERALSEIEKANFFQRPEDHAMFFETVIRYLGGLLSAYSLSGRRVLLEKADDLAMRLLPAFSTPSGMPIYAVNTESGELHAGPRRGPVIIAEFASCQMEYKYLAHLTGRREYFTAVERPMHLLRREQLDNGMWYTTWNLTTAETIDHHITIGAWADSAYEYLLKQYLMSARTEKGLRDMYIQSTSGAIRNLLYLTPTRNILYVTDTILGTPTRRFEHLSCFYPGLLALGAHALKGEMDEDERQLHLWAAEGLAYSCWLMYADQDSGLGPEIASMARPSVDNTSGDPMSSDLWFDAVENWKRAGRPRGKPPGVGRLAQPMPGEPEREKDYHVADSKYLLRPETIESIYIMWRTTGDEVWRERGWLIFLAIENLCRTQVGYASIRSVNRSTDEAISWMDEMPSYALAETWKYLYLMFLDHDPLPMHKYVFNTEAHPLPIFRWTDSELKRYNIH